MKKEEKNQLVSNVLERLNRIISYYDLSLRKFAISLGVHYNTIQNTFYRQSDVSFSILNKVITTYPEINPEWLMTGKGEMIRDVNEMKEMTKSLGDALLENKVLTHELADAKEEIKILQKAVEDLSVYAEEYAIGTL